MIIDEIYKAIRAAKNKGDSQRKCQRDLNISRNTVRRYWNGELIPIDGKAMVSTETSEKKEYAMAFLENYFKENEKQTNKKQKVTAHSAYEKLKDSLEISEATVRRYVVELKNKHPKAFMPLAYIPGEVMQIDWTIFSADIKNVRMDLDLFCAVLPYSYTVFCMILPDQSMESFIEGHIAAFSFFGGVSHYIWYDNLKTAVFKDSGKKAIKQEKFKALEAHYGFESCFMNSGKGNEKGAVENECKISKLNFLSPIPKASDIKEIVEILNQRVNYYNQNHKIKGKKESIKNLFAEEKLKLYPLPIKNYNSYSDVTRLVSKELLVEYKSNKYSIPEEYIGKFITLRVRAYTIEAWYKGKLITSHDRPYSKGSESYDIAHYLKILERKPRAINNAAPLIFGNLPKVVDEFISKISQNRRNNLIFKIFELCKTHNKEIVYKAIQYSINVCKYTYESIEQYLNLIEKNEQIVSKKEEDKTKENKIEIEKPDFSIYNFLNNIKGENND